MAYYFKNIEPSNGNKIEEAIVHLCNQKGLSRNEITITDGNSEDGFLMGQPLYVMWADERSNVYEAIISNTADDGFMISML